MMTQLSGDANRQLALAAAAAVVLLALLYYVFIWGGLAGLVEALDHCNELFCDFTRQYYPTGQELFNSGQPSRGYYYSSLFALWLVPFGRVSLETAVSLWGLFQIISVLLLFLSATHFWKESPAAFAIYAGLLAFSMPLLHNLKWGQVSVLVTGCLFATLLLYGRERRLAAAVVLALATAIKFYSGLFALYFVFKREWRFLGIYVLMTVLLWLVIPTILLGPETNWRFYQTVSERISHGLTTWIPEDINAQYLPSVATRLLGTPASFRPLWRLAGYALFGLNLLLIVRLVRAKLPGEMYWAFALLFLSLPFVAETSWPHYFVYLPYCQTLGFLALWAEGRKIRQRLSGLLLLVPAMVLASMPFFQLIGRWQDYSRLGFLFLANLLTLLLIYTLLRSILTTSRK